MTYSSQVEVLCSIYFIFFIFTFLDPLSYTLDGPVSAACLETGLWSETPPVCEGARRVVVGEAIYSDL